MAPNPPTDDGSGLNANRAEYALFIGDSDKVAVPIIGPLADEGEGEGGVGSALAGKSRARGTDAAARALLGSEEDAVI